MPKVNGSFHMVLVLQIIFVFVNFAACYVRVALTFEQDSNTSNQLASVVTSTKTVDLQVRGGILKGKITEKGVQRFLGVPFGAPPVGELRWQPPQPAANWSGVRSALEYSKSCAQKNNTFTDVTGVSEDCLYLNLWLPNTEGSSSEQDKYAAMIFFYGGSWTTGSAMFPLYTGEALTLANEATVVVTVNYRLAAFGFLGSDLLRANDNSTGNFGLQDQRLAMRWVHENAELLNVDTSKIMIFGESAGAGSVSSHLVSHRSRGLFTRAAMESGPFADWNSISLAESHAQFSALAEHLNCSVHAHSLSDTFAVADLQACLRSKTMTQVLESMKFLPSHGLVDWSPTVDGVEFADFVQDLAARGDIANVPVLMGTNQNEGTEFIDLIYNATEEDMRTRINQSLLDKQPSEIQAEVFAAYKVNSFINHSFASAAWWAGSEIIGDSEMTCSTRRSAKWLHDATSSPVYVYYFTYELDLIPLIEFESKKPLGVFHGSDLALVFAGQELLLTKEERMLSQQVRTFWTNFAFSGDPNIPTNSTFKSFYKTDGTQDKTEGLYKWPVHEPSSNLTLNLTIGFGTIANLKQTRCEVWDKVGPLHII